MGMVQASLLRDVCHIGQMSDMYRTSASPPLLMYTMALFPGTLSDLVNELEKMKICVFIL